LTTSGSKAAPDASVTPGAQLLPLDDQAIKGLREAGRQWPSGPGYREALQAALPVDPALEFTAHERHRRARFIHVKSIRPGDDEDLEATPGGEEGTSTTERLVYRLRRALIGPPLRSTAVTGERMGKALALPVLSPDALSSVAYGPEAMMSILVLAGAAELKLSLVLGAVIVLLMLAVGLGYRQVIKAYPHGGGSYIVASDSLGPVWGLIAGAGLTVDYIVTVAISVSAGVAAVDSGIPSLTSATVPRSGGMTSPMTRRPPGFSRSCQAVRSSSHPSIETYCRTDMQTIMSSVAAGNALKLSSLNTTTRGLPEKVAASFACVLGATSQR